MAALACQRVALEKWQMVYICLKLGGETERMKRCEMRLHQRATLLRISVAQHCLI